MGRRVRLRSPALGGFLGRPATVVAQVTGAGDAPEDGAAVILVTTWGCLEMGDGPSRPAASTLKASTGPDGAVRVRLRPAVADALLPSEESALAWITSLLPAAAATPRDAAAGLAEIVAHYTWEANSDLRRAVDVYLRQFRPQMLDTGAADLFQAWTYFDATVFAYLPEEGDPGGAVEAIAALPLRFKDWLGPFLQLYAEQAKAAPTLRADFQTMLERAREPAAMVDDFHATVRDFLAMQRGAAGQYVGRRAVESAVQETLVPQMDALPADVRTAVVPSLYTASWLLPAAGPEVMSAVVSKRAAPGDEIAEGLRGLATRVDAVEKGLVLKADQDVLQEIGAAVGRKVDADTYDNAQRELGRSLQGRFEELNAAVRSKAEKGVVDELSAAIGTYDKAQRELAQSVEGRFGELDTLVASKAEKGVVDELSAAVTASNNAQRELARSIQVKFDEVNTALGTKADADRLAQYQRETDAALRRKLDSKSFDTKMASFDDSVKALNRKVFGR